MKENMFESPEEMESTEIDLFENMEDEGIEEGSEGPDLSEVDEELLIAELENRGFSIEDAPEEGEEAGIDEGLEASLGEEPLV